MDRDKVLELLGELPLKELAVPKTTNIMKFHVEWNGILEESGGKPYVDELLEILKASGELQIYDGSMLNMGSGFSKIEFGQLANWLIWRAAHTSPKEAVEDLEKSVSQDSSDAWDVLVLDSLAVPRFYEITEDIFIMPLADAPESYYKYELEKQRESMPVLPGAIPPDRCVLVQRRAVAPRFREPENSDGMIEHGVSRGSQLFDLARCFTLIQDACPIPSLEYTQICDHVPCAQFTGWGAGSPLFDVVSGPSFKLTDEVVVEVVEYFSLFRNLPQEDKPFIGLVMDRLNQAKRRRSLADKAIDLGMALEVLLLRKERPHTQIQMTVRLRGAWLLGEDVSSRKEIYGHLGKMYSHRSAAVHQGVLNPGTSDKQKKLMGDMERGISLCIDAIKKLMDIGYPDDWNDIVLGGRLEEPD